MKTLNEVAVIAPNGRRYRARYDGLQDFTPSPAGIQAQYTALEEIPGLMPEGGTTYGPMIKHQGFHIAEPQEAA